MHYLVRLVTPNAISRVISERFSLSLRAPMPTKTAIWPFTRFFHFFISRNSSLLPPHKPGLIPASLSASALALPALLRLLAVRESRCPAMTSQMNVRMFSVGSHFLSAHPARRGTNGRFCVVWSRPKHGLSQSRSRKARPEKVHRPPARTEGVPVYAPYSPGVCETNPSSVLEPAVSCSTAESGVSASSATPALLPVYHTLAGSSPAAASISTALQSCLSPFPERVPHVGITHENYCRRSCRY